MFSLIYVEMLHNVLFLSIMLHIRTIVCRLSSAIETFVTNTPYILLRKNRLPNQAQTWEKTLDK